MRLNAPTGSRRGENRYAAGVFVVEYHWRSDSWLTSYPQRAETLSAISRHDVPAAAMVLMSAARSPSYLSSRSVCFGVGMDLICH